MGAQEEPANLEQRSEEELRLSGWMKQAQQGDAQAYRRLLIELSAMLQRFTERAVRRFGERPNPSAASDLTQEILLAIHAKRHTYDPDQQFLPWVFGIARHKRVDWLREHFADAARLDIDLDLEDIISPEDSSSSSRSLDGGRSGDLVALLDHLKPRERQIIELTKLQGFSVAEVALKTGLSEANVKVLTHRGIAALRKLLEKRHG